MNEDPYVKLQELRARGDAAVGEMHEMIDEMVAFADAIRRGNVFYVRELRQARGAPNRRACD